MDDELRLEAGKLVLFRRNGLWQARIALGNRKYLWKSLKTSNTAEAKRLGLKLFHQTEYKLGEGLPVQTRSFTDVIDEYIAEREADNKLGKEAKRGSGSAMRPEINLAWRRRRTFVHGGSPMATA